VRDEGHAATPRPLPLRRQGQHLEHLGDRLRAGVLSLSRYDVDGLQALNFVAEGALGGGVSRSLCLDNYGKALSSRVLAFELDLPDSLRPKLRGLG
jgi:hypothetical protein